MGRLSRNSLAVAATVAAATALGGWGLAQQAMQRGPTRNPHGAITIPCASCHTSVSWSPLRAAPEFDHNRDTKFPLRGMHAKVACRTCHANLVFTAAPTQCADCHADIHRRQLGADCARCHTVNGWTVTRQNPRTHSARFPLIGGHAAVDCEACHKGAGVAQYLALPIQCGSCHINDFNSAKLVDHRAAGFPTSCESCHTIDSWTSIAGRFDHLRYTGFALVGAHTQLDCASCHLGNRYKGTPADCYSCHVKDYNGTTDPNHVTAGFPTTCSLCHNSISWATSSFNHSTVGFSLTGAHATLACAQCHANNRFAGTPTQCQGCHLADFNATNNPGHVAAGFPQDCSVCHSTASWAGATFNHTTTGFTLTGAHAPLQCVSCHANNNFTLSSTLCSSCHLSDFNSATNPNHVTSGFPTTCDVCHTTTAWTPASFDHSTTPFPLTGTHITTPCTSCHLNNVFAGTPTACYSCHKSEYQSTANPNHVAAAFPTTCADCHNTTSWSGATFNHTWFPIYSGNHAKVWTTCADCHTNANDYQAFSCTNCHTHSQASTDPEHQGVRNYSYGPTTCYSCHPTGQGGG